MRCGGVQNSHLGRGLWERWHKSAGLDTPHMLLICLPDRWLYLGNLWDSVAAMIMQEQGENNN